MDDDDIVRDDDHEMGGVMGGGELVICLNNTEMVAETIATLPQPMHL